MRPLVLPLAALALTAAGGALPDASLRAQARPAPDERPRERVRERTRVDDASVLDRDEVLQRLPGMARMRIAGLDGLNADRAMLGLSLGSSDERGVRVLDVQQGGPAEKAGIAEGDRIVQINETSLTLSREDADDPELRGVGERRLRRVLGAVKPGDEVTLVVARESGRRTLRVKTVAASSLASSLAGEPEVRVFGNGPTRGFIFGDSASRGEVERRMRAWRDSARVQAERRPALGLALQPSGSVRDTLGLFVGSVTEGGPAEKAGLVEGDRIAAINGVDVRVPRDDVEDDMAGGARATRFTRELRKAKPGDDVRLRVWTDGRYRDVTVKAGRAADVFKYQDGDMIRFGGDGMFTLPMPPRAPLAPSAPRAPRAPGAPGRVQIYRYPDGASFAPMPPLPPEVRTLRALPRVPAPPAPPARAARLRRWSEV
jgi:serine protease Do